MKKDWDRSSAPIGTIRVRQTGKQRTRFIKVTNDGPKQDRWMAWARWWWLRNKGPVPDGKRVVYLDGNTMNNRPDNIGLATPGDVIFIAGERDPKMVDKNRKACRKGTIASNQLRGRIRRSLEWLPTRWYAVLPGRGIVNRPTKSRSGLIRQFGGQISPGPVSARQLPFVAVRGHELVGFGTLQRLEDVPGEIRQIIEDRFAKPILRAPNPSGLCQCGCGARTKVATSNVEKGVSKGQHRRFVAGHWHSRK